MQSEHGVGDLWSLERGDAQLQGRVSSVRLEGAVVHLTVAGPDGEVIMIARPDVLEERGWKRVASASGRAAHEPTSAKWARGLVELSAQGVDLDAEGTCRRCGVATLTWSAPMEDGTPTHPPLCGGLALEPMESGDHRG